MPFSDRDFFFSSGEADGLSSSVGSTCSSTPSSSESSSSSLSGAPKALAGFDLEFASIPEGAAKLDSLEPELPPKPF